jgi:hypothetical protein
MTRLQSLKIALVVLLGTGALLARHGGMKILSTAASVSSAHAPIYSAMSMPRVAPPSAAGVSPLLQTPAEMLLLESWTQNTTTEVAQAIPALGNLALRWVTVSKMVWTGTMRDAQGSNEQAVVVKCFFEVQPSDSETMDLFLSSWKAEGAPSVKLARASSTRRADAAAQMCATSHELRELVLEKESDDLSRSRHAVPRCVHSTLGVAGDVPLCVAFERLSAGLNLFEELFRFHNLTVREGSVALAPARRVGSVMRARVLVFHALSLLEVLARGRADGRRSCAYADNWSPNFGVTNFGTDRAMIAGETGVYLNDLDGVNTCEQEGCVRADYEHWEDLPVLLLIAESLVDESDRAEDMAEVAAGESVLKLLSDKSLFSMKARLGLLTPEYFEAVVLGHGDRDGSDIDPGQYLPKRERQAWVLAMAQLAESVLISLSRGTAGLETAHRKFRRAHPALAAAVHVPPFEVVEWVGKLLVADDEASVHRKLHGALWCDDASFLTSVRSHFAIEQRSAELWRRSTNNHCEDLWSPRMLSGLQSQYRYFRGEIARHFENRAKK